MTVVIPLTRGLAAYIDDADAAAVIGRKWRALPMRHGSDKFYAVTGRGRGQVLLHRAIIAAPKGIKVDHRDGDGLNNRRGNLRLATDAQNAANSDRALPVSGYRGVHRKGAGWRAQCGGNRSFVRGVVRSTAFDAAHDYDRLAFERFGEFARLNFTPVETMPQRKPPETRAPADRAPTEIAA